MTSPRYARLFADILKRASSRTGDVKLPPNRYRSQEIELVEAAILRKKQQLERRTRIVQVAAIAAIAALSLGAFRVAAGNSSERAPAAATDAPAPTNSVHLAAGASEATILSPSEPLIVASANGRSTIATRGGSLAQVAAGSRLGAGSRLVVDPAAATTLSLSTGTRLDVEPGSEMGVVEEGRVQIFALDAGALHADVAKLKPAERFVVRTPDAEVEVRGTSFLVSVVASDPACGEGTTTRVRVDEGVVVVRHGSREDTLHRGDRWPFGCPIDEPGRRRVARPAAARSQGNSAAPPLDVATAKATSIGDSGSVLNSSKEPSVRAPSSRLSEENDVFAAAMLAKRSGKPWLAIDRLDGFLERYQTSPLAENAAVERMRLLMMSQPQRGVAAATQYLVTYPSGFARQEAEAIRAGAHP